MGQDKAQITLAGDTLLQRAIVTAQQVFPKVVVSVRQPRAGLELPQVCDTEMECGPLGGLVAGLATVDTPWMFALACDMPFAEAELIARLAALRGGHAAVVPQVGGHPQPLFAFYAQSALPVMRDALAGGEKRVRAVLQRLDVRYVSEAELGGADAQRRSFIDLDTPQDVQAAMTLLEK